MVRFASIIKFGLLSCLFLASLGTVRADILSFTVTGGSLTLSGNATVVGVGGPFAYTAQGTGSLLTNYTGSFTVDVNNLLAPTSIVFNSANLDANTNGTWSPNNSGNSQTPAELADYGVRVNDIQANGKLRNIVFNVSGGASSVSAGSFSVANQSWSYATGNIDVFSTALDGGTSATLTGSANNTNVTLGTYSVLGNTITMTVPVTISIAYTLPGDTVVTGFNNYSGTLTAISAVPEPTSIALLAFCGVAVAGARLRFRNRK